MNIRIVVADEREANFFDTSALNSPLSAQGSIHNPTGGRKDRDLETDREGRRFGGTVGVTHGGGPAQSHHHGVDGERSTERHELTLFAKEVGQRVEAGRVNHEFEKLILVAPPKMLGLLRQALPPQSQALLAAEVPKDIVHQGPEAIRQVVPREAFSSLNG
jgi:protein required for attachment to host cells